MIYFFDFDFDFDEVIEKTEKYRELKI